MDTLNIFENPVDSIRVAVQNITTDEVTGLLNLGEAVVAFLRLLVPLYIILVCVSYYVAVKRIPGLKTNSVSRRNLLMLILTVAWGFIIHLWQEEPILDCLVTGLCVFAFYELIFKKLATSLEKTGFIKLPEWYIDEVQEEKRNDIAQIDKLKIKP